MSEKPLPCPWCITVDAIVRGSPDGQSAYVRCPRCGACGPTRIFTDEAVAAWNKVAGRKP